MKHWSDAGNGGKRRRIPWTMCRTVCGLEGLARRERFAMRKADVTCKTCLMILYKRAGW